MNKLFLFVFALSVVSCGKNELPDYKKLGALSVLAIEADSPEASPGDVVQLSPVVTDVAGAGRTIEYRVTACPDRGVFLGSQPTCEGVASAVSIAQGTIQLAAPIYTEKQAAVNVTIPANLLDGLATIAEKRIGLNYIVTFEYTAGSDRIKAFTAILVTDAGKLDKNQNPTLQALNTSGALFNIFPGGSVQVDAVHAAGSQESGETLQTTWFSSDGVFSKTRVEGLNPQNTYTPPKSKPSGHGVVVVGVTRDNRGGISAVIQELL